MESQIDLITWALAQLRARRRAYDLYEAYYDGRHRLTFASDRMRDAFGDLFRAFSLNLCAPVVDTLADRLRVIGFSSPGSTDEGSATDAHAVWERNRMPARHGRLHRDVLVMGDAYVHVWQDRDGTVRLYDESPREVVVRYDPDRPGEVEGAVKVWRSGKHVRVTAYYADRIERFITKSETDQLPEKLDKLRELDERDVAEGADARWLVAHGWGVVPMFHFPNNPGHDGLGRSELRDVVPLQDALNKSVADMLTTSEYHALPLRYLIGAEVETDPATGKAKPLFSESRDRVVALGKGVQAGQWDPGDVGQLLELKREHAVDIARVSGVPMHTLLHVPTGDWPSGEALRVAESRLVSKATDRAGDWGPEWGSAVQLGARMRAGNAAEVRTMWATFATLPSEHEQALAAQAKQAAGIPRAQTWREMGYSETQIAQFESAYASEQEAIAEQRAKSFDQGLATGGLT